MTGETRKPNQVFRCMTLSTTACTRRQEVVRGGDGKPARYISWRSCRTEKIGRVRHCKLGQRRLEEEMAWLARYRKLWDARFDELDKVVEELKLYERVASCGR